MAIDVQALVAEARAELLAHFERTYGHSWNKKKMASEEVTLAHATAERKKAYRQAGKRFLQTCLLAPGGLWAAFHAPAVLPHVLDPWSIVLVAPCLVPFKYMDTIMASEGAVTYTVSLRVAYAYSIMQSNVVKLEQLDVVSSTVADARNQLIEAEAIVREAVEARAGGKTQRHHADRILDLAAEVAALVTLALKKEEMLSMPASLEELEPKRSALHEALEDLALDVETVATLPFATRKESV